MLFFLWGFRSMTRTLAMATFPCRTTNQPAAHRLSRVTRWFTVFFIPVIPLGRRHLLTCSACGQSYKVTKEEAAEIVARAEAPQQENLPTQAR
jgi:hypothetical protein